MLILEPGSTMNTDSADLAVVPKNQLQAKLYQTKQIQQNQHDE
jgi:hypothetical protein